MLLYEQNLNYCLLGTNIFMELNIKEQSKSHSRARHIACNHTESVDIKGIFLHITKQHLQLACYLLHFYVNGHLGTAV